MEKVTERILRLPQVREYTGFPTSTIYDHVRKGLLPSPVKIGPRAVGWLLSDLEKWLEKRMEKKSHA